MDKLLDRIGLYEIISSLVAGIIEVSVTCFVIYFSFCSELSLRTLQNTLSDFLQMKQSTLWIIAFLFFCLCVGMIFNEIGDLFKWVLRRYYRLLSKIGKFFHKNAQKKRPSANDPETKNHLTVQELNLALKLIQRTIAQKELPDAPHGEDPFSYVFNYANSYLALKGKNQFIRKMQILSSLFRGLIVFSLTLLIGGNLLVWTLDPPHQMVSLPFNLLLFFLTFMLFPMIENKYQKLLYNFTIRHFVVDSLNDESN